MHTPDELKELTEEAIERFDFWPDLHGQSESMRYALHGDTPDLDAAEA